MELLFYSGITICCFVVYAIISQRNKTLKRIEYFKKNMERLNKKKIKEPSHNDHLCIIRSDYTFKRQKKNRNNMNNFNPEVVIRQGKRLGTLILESRTKLRLGLSDRGLCEIKKQCSSEDSYLRLLRYKLFIAAKLDELKLS